MKTEKSEKDSAMDAIREVVREEVRSALCSTAPFAQAVEGGPARILSGDIRYFRLPEVLHMVSLQGLTGRLSMSSDGSHVDIYFRSGEVAYATGLARTTREQLGHLLVKMGRLAQGALDEALSKCGKTGQRLGRVLVDDGLVSGDDIRAALMRQTERSVYRAMAWGEGRFYFELCALPGFVEDIPLGLKAEDLVLEGVRRVEEIRIVSEKIPRLDIVFVKPAYTPDEVERLALKPEEKRVLDLVDGERDVSGLIKASGLGEFSLLRALYALYSVGIIKKSGPPGRADRTQYL